MPKRTPPPRRPSTGRTATLASLMAAGVSAPTLAFADDALGLSAETVTWEPAPLQLVSTTDGPLPSYGAAAPALALLPDLDDD